VFVQPTLEEVRAYCRERNRGVDPELWLAHYQANGWRVGKNPMKDWRASVRTWERNRLTNGDDQAHRAGGSGAGNIKSAPLNILNRKVTT